MAKNETKRIRPIILQEDRDALTAIKGFKDPVYKPAKDDYTTEKLEAAQKAVVDARELEVQKQAEADMARDATVAAEWAFHNVMLAAKDQVKAQYGDDSDEYAAMGLTKKSERQSPGRQPRPRSRRRSGTRNSELGTRNVERRTSNVERRTSNAER